MEKFLNCISLHKLGISWFELYKLVSAKNSFLKTRLFGKEILADNSFWYLHGLKEIFIDEIYRFNNSSKQPRIIDCGSNIGLSIIFFKKIYPNSQIIGLEPDKKVYRILEKNLESFDISDVDIRNAAVWISDGLVNFLSLGSVSGHISSSNSTSRTVEVESIRLRNLLKEKTDFLKIDIEGAEYKLLLDCSECLKNVENIFVEYHSMENEPQMLGELLNILKKNGFKYYLKEAWVNQKSPYINNRNNMFDLQLNIFGYRVEK